MYYKCIETSNTLLHNGNVPIDKATRKSAGFKEEPIVFRLAMPVVERLNALKEYGGVTLVKVIETLIDDAYEAIEKKDGRTLERCRQKGIEEMTKRKAKRKRALAKSKA